MTSNLRIEQGTEHMAVRPGPGSAAIPEVFRTEVPGAACRVDGAAFRETMASLPTAVSVVTALDADGVPRGLTCSAVCSVSAEPPQILICVNQRNGSLAAIRHSGAFVVNILGAGHSQISNLFASPAAEKFAEVSWHAAPSSGLPVLDESAHAFLDCELTADITAGSHSILVGAVHACGADLDAAHPLLYWRRAYGTWLEDALPGE
ncbi:MAG TPA: flavin reductase family protein [Jatrophihabitans sp.]|nr:flavin reductase family protein [Jatrophihabitans sp.]